MGKDEVRLIIEDARTFNRYCMYDEALEQLNTAKLPLSDKNLEQEILKLKSYVYRKLENPDMALLYINKALHCIKNSDITDKDVKYSICLMNKGVIYDEQKKYKHAIRIYKSAVNIFRNNYRKTGETGKLINSLINLGYAYHNNRQYMQAINSFEEALSYFENDNKAADIRYRCINNILREEKQEI